MNDQLEEEVPAEDQSLKQWLQWIEPSAVNDQLEEEVPAAVTAVPEEVPAAVAAVPEEVLAAVTAVPVQQIEPTSAPLHLLRPGEAIDAASVIPQASCAVSLPMAALSLLPSHHSNLLNRVLLLARSIRRPRSHVGYVAFVCFALCKRLLVHMWEGAYRVSLIHHYAPWALEDITAETACDGICCCIAPAVPGGVSDTTWYPVSADHPLNEVRHWLAGILMDQPIPQDTNTMAGFYSAIGIAVLGTVCDGDCGLDAMCMMARLQQNADQRDKLREEIHDYIVQRAEEPQLHDLLVVCGELSLDEVYKYRESIASGRTCGEDGIFVVSENTFADAGESDAKPQITETALAALKWSTSTTDDAIIEGLALQLPLAVLQEQLALYDAHLGETAVAVYNPNDIVVYPNLQRSRMQVAALFNRLLTEHKCIKRRLPRGMLLKFLSHLTWASAEIKWKTRCIRRWHAEWLRSGEGHRGAHRLRASGKHVMQRQRNRIARDMPLACPWVRNELYAWFVSMRYSIDWKAVTASVAPQLRYKCLARFTRSLVRAKARQLLQLYLHASLTRGIKTKGVELRSRWFKMWESAHGLNMKKPNRKYKVSKTVLAERLEIGWLNAVRVRALCLAKFGYEPDFENFDESPFHNNESGSKDVYTLAVAGTTVPVVEGHADTRERWTANLTTWSNKQRILHEGPPQCEFMFKGNGEVLKMRLQEHIRRRGVERWASATTSEKASYRVNDILDFLERHLPPLVENRKWRIMQADDAKAHLAASVFRTCWNRGYVFIPLGGGVTPVVQVVDSDLNQPVSREYQKLEVMEHISQMRSGVSVPSCKPEVCIDNMVGVLRRMELHLKAADGFEKTGWLCSLDNAAGDEQIVREAGHFWRTCNMRAKVNAAVADVRTEVAAGRLQWNQSDVQRLIKPYPRRGKVDAILENIGDDAGNDLADESGDEAMGDNNADTDHSADESDLEGAGKDKQSAADAGDDEQPSAVPNLNQPSAVAEDIVSPEEVECVLQSRKIIAALQHAKETCQQVGAMSSVVHLDNQIRHEERKMRQRTREDPDLLIALAHTMDMEAAETVARKRRVDEANANTLSIKKVHKAITEANAQLRSTRHAILDAEKVLQAKHAAKTFTIEDLGGGGGRGKKQRLELLDRLSRLGAGLAAQQRNDFDWFKKAWDTKMSDEHGDAWPGLLGGWVQQVLSDHAAGISNAFSVFVHFETVRVFHEEVALYVPGVS